MLDVPPRTSRRCRGDTHLLEFGTGLNRMGKDEETCANISLLSWGTSLGMGRSFLVGDEDKWEALNYTGRGCYTVCLLGIGFKSFIANSGAGKEEIYQIHHNNSRTNWGTLILI